MGISWRKGSRVATCSPTGPSRYMTTNARAASTTRVPSSQTASAEVTQGNQQDNTAGANVERSLAQSPSGPCGKVTRDEKQEPESNSTSMHPFVPQLSLQSSSTMDCRAQVTSSRNPQSCGDAETCRLVENSSTDPFNKVYEEEAAKERQILKNFVPIAQLVGDDEDNNALKQFAVGTWTSLLSPRGVSVAALCNLRDEVLQSERGAGVRLVTLLEDMQDNHGTLVQAGRTIKLTASSQTSTKWKGKSSYANGGVLRFNPNQVSEVKPRTMWTIEDYCEHVVKSEVGDSKTFYLDEIDDEYVGLPGQGYFISQARSCTFISLCDALTQYFDSQDHSQCFVWLDLFSANQGLLTFGDASKEVQKQREGVLKHGLHHIIQQMDGGCLLFMDQWRTPAALGRAWVIWELLGVSLTGTKFDIVLPNHASQETFDEMLSENIDQVTQSIMNIDVGKAQCGNPKDLEYLQAKWEDHEDTVNNFIRNHLRKWFAGVAQQRGQVMLDRQEYTVPTAHLLNGAAQLLQGMGKYNEALSLCQRALEIYEMVLGPNHPGTSIGLANLASVLQDMGKYNEALPLFKRSLAIDEKVYCQDHPSTLAALSNLGRMLQDMGKYTEALPLLERSLAIAENVHGPDHPDTSTGLNNLADLFQHMGKYSEALVLFKRSLEIEESIHGSHHPSTSTRLSNFARLLQDVGKYTEALPLLERSLAIDEKIHGPDHPDTSIALCNLAHLLQDMGKYHEAIPLLERSLEIDEMVNGPNHPDTSIGLNNLARVLQDIGKYNAALPLFERSLAIVEKTYGPDHPSISSRLSNLASLLQDLGRYSEALPMLERSLVIDEKAYGPDHVYVGIGLRSLGDNLRLMDCYTESEAKLESSLSIVEKSVGGSHTRTAQVLLSIGKLRRVFGSKEEGKIALQRAREIYISTFRNELHPHALEIDHELALYEIDSTIRKRKLEQVLARREQLLGHDHPHTVQSREGLALRLT